MSTYWDDQAVTRGGRDATFHGIPWDEGTAQMVDLILPWLPDSGTVADLGCGIGRMTVPLAEARPDLDFVGVDASEPMLAQALPSPDNVTFVHADVTSLPHAMEVEGAFSTLVVQHLDPAQVTGMFAEVRRVLTGRFVCQWVPGEHHAPNDHRYQLGDMRDMWGRWPLLVDTLEDVHPDWKWGVWEA